MQEIPAGVTIPQIPYRPSVNCAYSQLVSRIQGSQSDSQERKEAVAEQPTDYAQMTYEQQQYYQYYYMQQYYEYCKQLAAYQQGQTGSSGMCLIILGTCISAALSSCIKLLE